MFSLLASLWEGTKNVAAALVPFNRSYTISPIVRWILWFLLDIVLIAILYFINDAFNLKQFVLKLPGVLQEFHWLRDWWLPIFGQLVVLGGVVLYWLYLLWFPTGDESVFPDIDEAWEEAMLVLTQAGIPINQLPLFLVLGRPASGEENLFEAAGMKYTVKPTPARATAPLRVFAGRLPNVDHDAVFVTCRGASILGKLAGLLAMAEIADGRPVEEMEIAEGADETLKPTRKDQNILEMLRASMGHETSKVKKRAMRREALRKQLGADFLADAREIILCRARLAHLCRLMVRDRHPYCGANGILLAIPVAGTDTAGEAQLTAHAAHDDLAVAREEMKLDCPIVAMLVDLEELPGFTDFLQRQPAKELASRRGSGFPMASRLSREEYLKEIRASLAWVCTTYMQDSVYPKFQMETSSSQDANVLFPANANLVLLLDEMNMRADMLATIIQSAIAPQDRPLLRYAGCYLAATGPKGSQGYVAGVFQKLVREQSCVSWTQAAFIEDAQGHRWATYYLVMTAILFLAWLAILAGLIWTSFGA